MEACLADGCSKPRQVYRRYCRMHRARVERHGDPSVILWTKRAVLKSGYVRLSGHADHPLADARGYVYEHRLVLWRAIGPGEHPCHHCATPVVWNSTLVVDHLNWDRSDNRPENLVPACSGCNSRRVDPRGAAKLRKGTCLQCGEVMYTRNPAIYCSRPCVNRAWRARHAVPG